MAIKRNLKLLLVLYCVVCISLSVVLLQKEAPIYLKSNGNHDKTTTDLQLSHDLEKPYCWVYAFLSADPEDDVKTETFTLEAETIYTVLTELATEHYGEVRIRIIDPEDREFKIGYAELRWNETRSIEVPFGTDKAGEYRFEIEGTSEVNFNLHVEITKTVKVFHDKLSSTEIDHLDLYEVKTFEDGEVEEDWQVELKTGVMYKLYIGRVSAIKGPESSDWDVKADYNLTDPDGNDYLIFDRDEIARVDDISVFFFGTRSSKDKATEVYSIGLQIFCNVAYVNIGVAIVEDYIICEPIEEDKDTDKAKDLFEMDNATMLEPTMMVGTFITVGTSTLLLAVGFMHHKNKGSMKASRPK